MSRFTLTPRAALVLAAIVVVVALVVIVLGARGSGAGETVSVVTAAPSRGQGAGAGAGAGAGTAAGAATGAASAASAAVVVVHVLGAVGRAGVVSLPVGSRVSDALGAAGGATDDADLARLNLARPLVDGERLYVPKVGQVEVPAALDASGGDAPTGAPGAPAPSDVVDLNTADQTVLETLPGIGPALAERILAWRTEHGRFAAVEDLLDVAGIGDVRFAELRERVRV